MPGEENVNTAAGALLRLFLVSALGVIAGDCGIAKIQRSDHDVLNLIRKPGHFVNTVSAILDPELSFYKCG